MANLSSSMKITLKCPKCSHTFQKTLAQLKPNAKIPCPTCGTTFVVKGDGFQSAGKSLDEFSKSLSKLGTKHKR